MLRCCFTKILRCHNGATAVEYAIIAPVLLLLLMGTFEYSMLMYASAVLEGSVAFAARAGKTGYVNTSSTGSCPSPVVNGTVSPQTQSQYLNCVAVQHSKGLFDSTKLQVTYNDTGSSTFSSSADTPTTAGPCTNNPAMANPPSLPLCSENTQNAGDIVVYTASYPWTIYTPLMRQFLGSNGTVTISSSAVVKNEPYSSSSR